MNKIQKAKEMIVFKNELLSYLLSRFEIVITKSFGKTAATNGMIISFNPDFLDSLEIEEVAFVLLHELLHITLDHLKRIGNRNRQIYNIAADIAVNDLLISSGYNYGNLQIIKGRTFKIDGLNYTVEEIYDLIDKNLITDPVTNHNYWTDEYRSYANKTINDAIQKGYVDITDSLYRYVKIPKDSGTDWRNILNNILKVNEKDYTFQKNDKRYEDFLLPDFTFQEENLENVWLLIDVSGSMRNDELVKVFSEISKIINSYDSVNLTVSAFSTFVTPPKKVKNIANLEQLSKKLESGGGTSFEIIFDYMLKLEKLPIAIIIFTDGYAQFPEKSKAMNIPVFWVLDNENITAPFGYNIKI